MVSGGFLIPDRSDGDLKLYDSAGRRTGAWGGRGRGPGEFTTLTSAGLFRDSVWGYDFSTQTITLFAPDGRAGRTIKVPSSAWSVRVLDDSLFLLASTVEAGSTDLLSVMRADGSVRSSFFDRSKYLSSAPDLFLLTSPVADGRDGLIFAGTVGSDSVFVFDYSGRQLAAGAVDATEPLKTYRSIAKANGNRLKGPNGASRASGVETVMKIVALDHSRAALHLVRWEAQTGVDLMEGGRVIVLAPTPEGKIQEVARSQISAGVVGRDSDGSALLLGYADEHHDTHVLTRLRLKGASERTKP